MPDLERRFAIPDIGLSFDATTLQLTDTTFAGQAVFGRGTVEVVGCDQIVVKVDFLRTDWGIVDLIEPSFYVAVLSAPAFDPATAASKTPEPTSSAALIRRTSLRAPAVLRAAADRTSYFLVLRLIGWSMFNATTGHGSQIRSWL